MKLTLILLIPVMLFGQFKDWKNSGWAGWHKEDDAVVTYSAEATALFARMTTQPDAARKRIIDDYIVQLKNDGNWKKLRALYVFAAHTQQAATLNWIEDDNNIILVNSPTFTVDSGFTSIPTAYINTQYIFSTDGNPVLISTDCGFGFVCQTENAPSNYNGVSTASTGMRGRHRNIANNYQFEIASTEQHQVGSVLARGYITAQRINDKKLQRSYNGNNFTTSIDIPDTGLPSINFYFLGSNNSGVAIPEAASRIYSVLFIGQSLSNAENLARVTATEIYLDAIGAGVLP